MSAQGTAPFATFFTEKTRNGLHKGPKFIGSGTKLVRMGDLFTFDRIRAEWNGYHLIELSSAELERHQLRRGDLLFCRTSVAAQGVGKCSVVVDASEELVPASNLIRVRIDPEKGDPDFFHYYFTSPRGHSQLLALTRGAAVFTITGGDIGGVEVPNLPLRAQMAISTVFNRIDDLIENNLLRIKLLEEMAQRVYREWFVDFRYPGYEGVPLVESELGPIPRGWDVLPFTDLAQVLSGGTPRTTEPENWGGAIPFFTPRDAPLTLVAISTEKKLTERGLAKCNSRLYPAGTVFITARGTVGKVAIAGVPMAMNQSCYALIGVDRGQEYILFALLAQVEYLKTNTGGATFDTVIVDTFRRMRVASPPLRIVSQFCAAVAPILAELTVLTRSMHNLREARDLLLPRLMSGQVDVDKLDIEVAEVAA